MKILRELLVPLLAVTAGLTIVFAQTGANGDEIQRKEYWQKRYAMVLSRRADAEVRIEIGRKAVRKARQRDRFKGQHRTAIVVELRSAQKELETVIKLLEEFPESARQAGVPPGWLREVEDRQGDER